MSLVRPLILPALAAFALAACDAGQDKSAAPVASTQTKVARPPVAPQTLAHGKQVFQQNCASCHGERAQGAPNWEKPGPDGKYPAPPLDGSAHAWHHPRVALIKVIKQGTQKIGGNMPAWQDKLSDADIDAVILYFQSLWSDEIYAAWKDIDARQGHR